MNRLYKCCVGTFHNLSERYMPDRRQTACFWEMPSVRVIWRCQLSNLSRLRIAICKNDIAWKCELYSQTLRGILWYIRTFYYQLNDDVTAMHLSVRYVYLICDIRKKLCFRYASLLEEDICYLKILYCFFFSKCI
jgi:hypothetical protein